MRYSQVRAQLFDGRIAWGGLRWLQLIPDADSPMGWTRGPGGSYEQARLAAAIRRVGVVGQPSAYFGVGRELAPGVARSVSVRQSEHIVALA